MPIFIAIAVLVWVFVIPSCSSDPETDSAQVSDYIELKSRAHQSVRRVLKDPGSAQFRGFFPGEIDGFSVGCGEVNAKNSLGGYTGFKRFVSAGGDSVELEGTSPGFSQAWSAICQPFISRQ